MLSRDLVITSLYLDVEIILNDTYITLLMKCDIYTSRLRKARNHSLIIRAICVKLSIYWNSHDTYKFHFAYSQCNERVALKPLNIKWAFVLILIPMFLIYLQDYKIFDLRMI